ncbi:hypothetical protein ABTM12_19465, partial [Acinetobacter baumannii]
QDGKGLHKIARDDFPSLTKSVLVANRRKGDDSNRFEEHCQAGKSRTIYRLRLDVALRRFVLFRRPALPGQIPLGNAHDDRNMAATLGGAR